MNQSGLYRGEDGTLSQPGGPNLSEKWVAMGSDGKQELPGASSWVEQIISRNVELKLKHTGEEAVIILKNTIKLYKEIIITEMQCRESNHFCLFRAVS